MKCYPIAVFVVSRLTFIEFCVYFMNPQRSSDFLVENSNFDKLSRVRSIELYNQLSEAFHTNIMDLKCLTLNYYLALPSFPEIKWIEHI